MNVSLSVVFFVASLLFTVFLVVLAIASRTGKQEGTRIWYFVQLPLAFGAPLLMLLEITLRLTGFNLPVPLWGPFAWVIGLWPASYVRKRKIDDQIPWQSWFGASRFKRGTRLATAVEASHIARVLYARGKRLENEDTSVHIVEKTTDPAAAQESKS